MKNRNIFAAGFLAVNLFMAFATIPGAVAESDDPVLQQKLEAVKQLESSGKSSTQLSDALFNLASYYYQSLGDYDSAEKTLRKCLDMPGGQNNPWEQTRIGFSLACVLALAGKTEQATATFNTAFSVAQANKDFQWKRDLNGIGNVFEEKLSDEMIGILTSLASNLISAQRLDEAEKFCQAAQAMNPTTAEKAKIAVDMAHIYQHRSQYDQAFRLLDETLAQINKPGKYDDEQNNSLKGLNVRKQMDDESATLLSEKAKLKTMLGDTRGAEEALSKIFTDDGLGIVESVFVKAKMARANNFDLMEKYSEAKQQYVEALEVAQSRQNDHELRGLAMQILTGLGAEEGYLGSFEDAQKHLAQALDLSRRLGNRTEELKSVVRLANVSLLRGTPEPALHSLLLVRSKVADKGIEPQAKGELLTSLGRCYQALGQTDAAIGSYKEALSVIGQTNDPSLKAPILNSLAVAYLDSSRLDDFKRLYEQAKAEYSKLNDDREQSIFEYNYAQAVTVEAADALKRGGTPDYMPAIAAYKIALEKVRTANDSSVEGTILRGLATAELLAGNPQAALDHYQQGLKLAEQCNSIEAKWDANLGIGKAYKTMNQLSQAETYLKNAVALVEQERNKLSRDAFKTHNLDFRKDCYIELTDVLFRSGKIGEALEIVERGRARAFLDMLSNRKVHRVVELAQVAPAELVASANLPSATPAKPQPGETGTRAVSVTPRAAGMDATVEETAISPVNAEPPSLEEIKALVSKRNSTCVEYFIAGNKLLAFIIKPDGTMNGVEVQIKRSDLEQKVARGYQTIINAPPANADEAKRHNYGIKRQQYLRDLHKVLIEPLNAYLPTDPASMVTIIPHDVLFMVPFAALIEPDGGYLVEKHTLSYAPAIGVLRATQKLATDTKSEQPDLFAIGNPITPEIAFIGALPYSEKEVKNIAQLFNGRSTVKIGAEATKPVFMSLAPKASAIHLATHGLINEEHPMQSSLVLAPQSGKDDDDGLLTVKDIMTMPALKANIVVLSACQTGRGKMHFGDGVEGLSRAFVIAGAPSVVVSQWNVDDIMTEFQMKYFYKTYLAGQDKAKALRDAQIATVRFLEQTAEGKNAHHEPDYVRANPRYWAAFELIGEK